MAKKIFFLLVIALFVYISSPLILPVAMGGVLAVLFLPWLERLEKYRVPTLLGAGVLTVIITLVILLPTATLIFIGAKSGLQQLHGLRASPSDATDWVSTLLNTPRLQSMINWVGEHFPIGKTELLDGAQDLVHSLGTKLTELLGALVSQLPAMALGLAVVVISLYFFMVDGRRLALFLRRNSMFSPHETDQLLATFAGTCRSVILAMLVTGAAQGIVEFLFCLCTGTPNAAMIGLLAFLGSFIPAIGSSPITFGVAIQQMLTDHVVRGCILAGGAVLIIVMDNFIRPLILRGSVNLHPLIAFVAAIGGLQTMGFLGVFIGPIVAAVFVVTLQIIIQPAAQSQGQSSDHH